ncbi:MAG: DHH family phosphoesterase [Candidatus Bathyarchaeota archaeon]
MEPADFDFERLREMLSESTLLLGHHNADPDSVCSAWGFQKLAEALDPSAKASIFLPGGASGLSRDIMKTMGIRVEMGVSLDDYDTLVMLDTATLNQLGGWADAVRNSSTQLVFIDHHKPHREVLEIASLLFVDESATSTCELVHYLYEGYGIIPSPPVAKALLLGITYDSRHFSIATPRTLNAASTLLEIDGSLGDILSMLFRDRDRSEKIARLKAAQRMQLHYIDDWTIVTSHLSSFQASAARSMISLGADVSIVCSCKKGKLIASLRSSDRFYRGTSVHLGEIAQILGSEFSGSGSGHPTAAGVNCEGDLQGFLIRAASLVRERVGG